MGIKGNKGMTWRLTESHKKLIRSKRKYNQGMKILNESSYEWDYSFQNFINDMGKKPSHSHSIERIDNDKGYSKENCVWATRSEQNKNQRLRTKIEYNGEVRSITQWSRLYNINIGTLRRRLLVLGYPIEKALIK